jgi:hypothetical protein
MNTSPFSVCYGVTIKIHHHNSPTSWARSTSRQKKNACDFAESSFERQGDANIDAVRRRNNVPDDGADLSSGLDNAGKTTVVKRLMNEDVNVVSPTLGFIIKTIDYKGQVNGVAYGLIMDGLTNGPATNSTYVRWSFLKSSAASASACLCIWPWARADLQDIHQGTLGDKRLCGHTGGTILKKPTPSSGWLIALIAYAWQIAKQSWLACYSRRQVNTALITHAPSIP